MTLFIDGDALPKLLKPILFRTIERLSLATMAISNKPINIGLSNLITYIIVEQGADEADNRIVEMVSDGDLVITADIPLADRVISKNAHALDHRGKLYSTENIKGYLAMRNLMQEIRDNGGSTQGPAAFGPQDAREFAGQLNKFMTRCGSKY